MMILIIISFLQIFKKDTRRTSLKLLINNIIKIFFFFSCIALLIGLESDFILILLIDNLRRSNELGNLEIKKIKSF
jgi:hypothetical protein